MGVGLDLNPFVHRPQLQEPRRTDCVKAGAAAERSEGSLYTVEHRGSIKGRGRPVHLEIDSTKLGREIHGLAFNLAYNRPDESDQLTSNSGRCHFLDLASVEQYPVAAAQPLLCLPSDGLRLLGRLLSFFLEVQALPGRKSIAPG